MATGNLGSRFSVKHITGFAAKIVAIAVFVWLTNTGFIQRVDLLIEQGRWATLVGFVGVWGLSLMALLAAAFQGSRWLRFGWAAVISLTTAVGFAYHKASGSEFGVLDALSLWNARHEAAPAAEFYTADLYWLAAVMVAGFIVFAMPPAAVAGWPRRWLTRLAWLPALPVVTIAAIVMIKQGGGSEALPTKFGPLSVGLVMGSKVTANPLPQRRVVSLPRRGSFETADNDQARPVPIRRIVLLVDESARADYIDWTPGNPYTPQLARLKDRIVDFGPAASGGNCSHYASLVPLLVITGNAALRARFQAAADASRDHGSHFSIAPTVLELLGYDPAAVAETQGPSLLTKSARVAEFTSGDVFGLFSEEPNRHAIDLGRNYLEPAANPKPAPAEAHTAQAVPPPAQ